MSQRSLLLRQTNGLRETSISFLHTYMFFKQFLSYHPLVTIFKLHFLVMFRSSHHLLLLLAPLLQTGLGFRFYFLKIFCPQKLQKLFPAYFLVFFRRILRFLHMGIWRQVPKLLILTCGECRYTSIVLMTSYFIFALLSLKENLGFRSSSM